MEGSKRTGVFVWGGIAAAAAGIFAVAIILQLRDRKKSVAGNFRDIQDVLSDCYQKIREIEEHLPVSKLSTDRGSRREINILSNGNTVLDAG